MCIISTRIRLQKKNDKSEDDKSKDDKSKNDKSKTTKKNDRNAVVFLIDKVIIKKSS